MRFLKALCLLCALCASVVRCFSLDRNAFTFTNYNLNVRVEPEQQRLGVRGKITLRNDSGVPQKVAALQISSSLDWRSIQVDGKPVQFVSQPYTSDIDHTGSLSEAIVTLPREVAPKQTIDLDIGYEGTIPLDATRLTRIGVPEDVAKHSDWDRISPAFTVVRGAGYVAWYPVSMESANLSEGNTVFETLGRWRARETDAQVKISFDNILLPTNEKGAVVFCNGKTVRGVTEAGTNEVPFSECTFAPLGIAVPSFAIGNFEILENAAVRVYYAPNNRPDAEGWAEAAGRVLPLVQQWFGEPRDKAEVLQLLNAGTAPFESGDKLLTPFSNDPKLVEITLVHALAHAAFPSPRPWIYEGLAHFAQALWREQQAGRQAALDYMGLHGAAVAQAEKTTTEHTDSAAGQSLISTYQEEFYRSKAMLVWWMLRDMVGEPALKKALAAYRPEDDKEPSYVQRLIESQSKRDLEWFFDDWVYRDRGLPDFRVASAYPRATVAGGYVVTVSVENLGGAGAEVPVTLRIVGGEVTKRLMVRGKSTAAIRIEVPSKPEEVVVNDGSVPESDMSNNTFEIKAQEQ